MRIIAFLICFLFAMPAFCQEAESEQAEPKNVENEINPTDLIHYSHYADMPKIKELDESEDDLYSGSEIKPLDIKISEEEKMQDMSSDFDYIDKEYELPELLCNNESLTKQVAHFIQSKIKDENESSVRNRRSRLLMIKNLHDFAEISEEELNKQDNFKTKAAIVHLRINESKDIYKICESTDNSFGRFKNIYLVIYPYFKYYKVLVANLMISPEKMDEASFIYSW